MLSALLFLTVMANRPLPDIPWFALSEINEINEINEIQGAHWINLHLCNPITLSHIRGGLSAHFIAPEKFHLPSPWVESVQTPPPEMI